MVLLNGVTRAEDMRMAARRAKQERHKDAGLEESVGQAERRSMDLSRLGTRLMVVEQWDYMSAN